MAAERTVSRPLAQLPNALTIGRLVVIPIYVWLILASDRGHSVAAAAVFAAAGITDQIDGYLARRWHVESAFGKIADPLADRLLIDVAVILLWHAGRLPWAALAIPARDIVLIGATPFFLGRGYSFEVNRLGKAATWLLYASLGLVMLVHRGWPLWVFWAGFVLAVLSLGLYTRKAKATLAARSSRARDAAGRKAEGDGE